MKIKRQKNYKILEIFFLFQKEELFKIIILFFIISINTAENILVHLHLLFKNL